MFPWQPCLSREDPLWSRRHVGRGSHLYFLVSKATFTRAPAATMVLMRDVDSQAEVAAGLICNAVLLFPSYFNNPFRSRLSYREECRASNSSRQSGRFSNTPETIMRHPEAIRWSNISGNDAHESTNHHIGHSREFKMGLGSWLQLSEVEIGAA